jgi:hypothetical protein
MVIQTTRYGKIRERDLSDCRVWLDAGKNRYQERGIWRTLDARLVAVTFRFWSWFGLGVLMRLILALLGSNRYEPFPIGNREYVNELWDDDPDWLRWLKWHLRNPWCDLRKFYFGFGYATLVEHERKSWGWVHWARFDPLPFKVPFPEWETRYFVVGWEQRGILSASA